MSIAELRDVLTDQAKAIEYSERFALRRCEKTPGFDKFVAAIVKSNMQIVFEKAESEIEKLFLATLVNTAACCWDTLMRYRRPPEDFVEPSVENYRERLRQIGSWKSLYENLPSEVKAKTFEQFMDFVKATEPSWPDEDYNNFIQDALMEFDLKLESGFVLIPQARFASVLLNGVNVRCDAYIFSPANEQVRVIVECDGFKFHGGKESFISDRQRDRAFADAGYDVRRYSGTEIWNDPIGVVGDLVEFLGKFERASHIKAPRLPKAAKGNMEDFIEFLRGKRDSGKIPCVGWEWSAA